MRHFQIFVILTLASFDLLHGQQLPLFTQNREYHSYLNPATINSDYFTYLYRANFGISYHSQWAGVEYAPKTYFARGEYLWDTPGSVDLIFGAHFLSDNIDPIFSNGIFGRVAAVLADDPYYGGISLGLQFGWQTYQIDFTRVEFLEDEPFVTMGLLQDNTPDIGIGLYYYKQFRDGFLAHDHIYAGISVPRMLEYKLNFNNGPVNYGFNRHYYGIIGWYNYLNESSFVEPSLWIRYPAGGNLSFDLLCRYQMNRSFWIGGGIGSSESILAETGVVIGLRDNWQQALKIGYAFRYGWGQVRNVLGGSHELNLTVLID